MKRQMTLDRLKPWVLPGAMLAGVIFHNYMSRVEALAPYLIFAMLLITFCKVKPKELKITGLTWSLLTVQTAGAVAVYLALLPFGKDIAQGTMICVFCPTATAAPVITGMLGGSVTRLATFSIVSNITVAITAPLLFSAVGSGQSIDFIASAHSIATRVVPLIIAPLALAFILLAVAPKAHAAIASKQSWSFYIWAVSLFIVVGRAVSFVISEPAGKIPEMIVIALCSAAVCGIQFIAGRRIGARFGDKIAGAQGLGQKNTVLAIWMALTYLNPISSVGPAAYVAWQNTVNTLQLYYHDKKTRTRKL